MSLTAERLRELLEYSPETGIFVWKSTLRTDWIGKQAGSKTGKYSTIFLDGKRRYAHRLVWLFCHCRWPQRYIDHINGNGHDNRLANLREATPSDNFCNSKVRIDSRSRLKGVKAHRSRFMARIKKDGVHFHLGTFDTPQEAYAAYCDAARKLHGNFANMGG